MIVKGLDSTGLDRILRLDDAGRVVVDDMNEAASYLLKLYSAVASVGSEILRTAVINPLPAGDENIGNVDIVSAPTLTVQPPFGNHFDAIYSGYAESEVNNSLDAGTNHLNLDALPTGFLRKITCFNFRYTGTTAGVSMFFRITNGSVTATPVRLNVPTSGEVYTYFGSFVLSPGYYGQLRVEGATAADQASVNAFGYNIATA